MPVFTTMQCPLTLSLLSPFCCKDKYFPLELCHSWVQLRHSNVLHMVPEWGCMKPLSHFFSSTSLCFVLLLTVQCISSASFFMFANASVYIHTWKRMQGIFLGSHFQFTRNLRQLFCLCWAKFASYSLPRNCFLDLSPESQIKYKACPTLWCIKLVCWHHLGI